MPKATLLHDRQEPAEHVRGVVRSWSRFGVVLRTHDRSTNGLEGFHRSVVQILSRHPTTRRQRLRIDGEAMVLTGDGHDSRVDRSYRLIGPVVTELQFEGLCSESQA